ncbi:uncharacterized protein JCM15063_004063 [Sporobolomyces koalae]|uniref:uncharacterized protein n=1 Tax=Sporobolomyces koalae TaxID=500713 RepID=UPI00316C5E45
MDLHRVIHGPERKPFDSSGGRLRKIIYSYSPDWILSIVLVGLIGGLTNKAGYKREFSLLDTSIQHTFAVHERITFAECIVYAGVIPAILIVITGAFWRRSFWDVHNGVLGLLLSVSITTVATQVIKVCVGRPRPDMISRCQPIEGAANLPVYGLATAARVCTVQTGHIIDDGFKSFPSGHSSFAFAGLLYLSLYAAGKMHLFDRRGHAIKAWISVTPLIGASLIAVSRTMDYRHHATDVIAGSILGSLVAILTYHLYYPSLLSRNCHLPFSPRIPPLNAATSPGHHLHQHDSGSSLEAGGRTHELPLHSSSEGQHSDVETCPRPQGGNGVSYDGSATKNGDTPESVPVESEGPGQAKPLLDRGRFGGPALRALQPPDPAVQTSEVATSFNIISKLVLLASDYRPSGHCTMPARATSPTVASRQATSSRPTLSLKLLACGVACTPFLFEGTVTELLHPLFSSAPTHSRETTLPLYATLFGVLLVQRSVLQPRTSWRTYWFIVGGWKILSRGLVRWFGEKLLTLGLERGVLSGRFLLEAVPFLALANWTWEQFDSKERAEFLPKFFVPSAWAIAQCLSSLNKLPSYLSAVPSCYILPLQGLFLVSIALFARHPALHRIPRSQHRPHSSPPALLPRFILFALALGLAHIVVRSTSHCGSSSPIETSTSRVLASRKSLTGIIMVGEHDIGGGQGYQFRYLRADHSLLGGLWTGISATELRRQGIEPTEQKVVETAESIYSTFILQELIRLVKTPLEIPHQSPEQGLVIGLGAGLIARALDQHRVNLTICEIDPVVYDFAREYFAVPEPAQVLIFDVCQQTFNYIVHDVFTGGQVPSALFTVEFWSTVRTRLHRSGILAVNFAGSLGSAASRLVLSTLVHSFPHCRAFEDNPSSSGSTRPPVEDQDTLKNLVVFCSASWFVPIEFRDPNSNDFLSFPSPRARRQVFANYLEQEISLDRFKLLKEEEAGGDTEAAVNERKQWLLTNKNRYRLEQEQYEGTKQHWKAMEQVLPRSTWANW